MFYSYIYVMLYTQLEMTLLLLGFRSAVAGRHEDGVYRVVLLQIKENDTIHFDFYKSNHLLDMGTIQSRKAFIDTLAAHGHPKAIVLCRKLKVKKLL